MRERKFTGFDDIHCQQNWKNQLLDQIASSQRRKRACVWRFAMIMLLALLSFGTAFACSESVRDWLSSLFTDEQEEAQVKEAPVSVQALN